MQNFAKRKTGFRFAAILLTLTLAAGVFAGCSKAPEEPESPEQTTEQPETAKTEETAKEEPTASAEGSGLLQFQQPAEDSEIAIMETSAGTVKLMLFPQVAPKAVENFVTHAKNGYYDNLTFHRVIDKFMIQGGDPTATGTGGESIWGKPFEDEFSTELHNFRGALCMANSGANTNGSQFFIVQATSIPTGYDNQLAAIDEQNPGNFTKEVIDKYVEVGGAPWLDYHHTVFGQVIEGMDVIDKLAKETKVEDQNGTVLPENQPVIKSIKIEPASGHINTEASTGSTVGDSE